MDIQAVLASEFKVRPEQIKNTVELLDDGKTVPFIARYRKELTGSLDDQVLRQISERLDYLRNLEKRKEEIIGSIEAQGKLTDELRAAVQAAATLVEAEDLYRPYKQKKKTRASVARERGLEPLAQFILAQDPSSDPVAEARGYITDEVPDCDAAIAGACDIIAEDISDDASLRKKLRAMMFASGLIKCEAAKEDADQVYKTYFDFCEPVSKMNSHRVLAVNRGEREEQLKVQLVLENSAGEKLTADSRVLNGSPCGELVKAAALDSYKRLIFPSVEREVRSELTDRANEGAIKVFSANLKQLLMQPPIKDSVTLGLDPAYRTGCKIAVVDGTGKVLETAVVYPTPPQSRVEEAAAKLKRLIDKYGVRCISIGNGTASRESEAFVADLVKPYGGKVRYMVVSEAGASVYSASPLAAQEFPQFDVSLRSAVSIARRLQDPLAELVKIDPKSIGVGQYQHDMPPARLSEALGGVVEDCVNSVGVDLNTASVSLLSYISGINLAIAKNIVAYREENGAFSERKQLLKVPKLGPKAYEQCAGFLRIPGGKNPLDNTSVHPESYDAVAGLLDFLKLDISDVAGGLGPVTRARLDRLEWDKVASKLGIGVPTLKDIAGELKKPGRDPRSELPPPLMRSGEVMELKDLKEGMELVGTVRNVIDFGCFVDIGVHVDGLVHISRLCDHFVKHPLEVVSVGQVVKVRVLEVDVKRNRISLTMKGVK